MKIQKCMPSFNLLHTIHGRHESSDDENQDIVYLVALHLYFTQSNQDRNKGCDLSVLGLKEHLCRS